MQSTPETKTPNPVDHRQQADDLSSKDNDYTNTMNSSDEPTCWYKSQVTSSLSFTVVFMLWFTSGSYMLGQLNAAPTKVILKKDGCTYMRHQHIITEPYDDDDDAGMCAVNSLFRSNLIGNGGVFKLENREVQVAENQIVAVEKLDNYPYNESQKRLVIWLCINSFLMFATMGWTIFCLL
jgi:hypothetical protein